FLQRSDVLFEWNKKKASFNKTKENYFILLVFSVAIT
ncbi:hypothetical protein AAUPMC_19134, partial [Pasteurella multocida subsp. multocida str. Anand1_cattle]